MKTKYYVRSLPLHHEKIVNGKKSRQIFQMGETVELDVFEAIKYQHLIETEEQYQSRQPKITTVTVKKEK
ncbi:hypothetical protein [Pleurocapsa sp. FMAR1]|uniref:hypothetical protein n=1 Tax=Pleurocapsa sp. FMAR1 TaxID=3040204 RepID=UPI0029C9AE0F|nr:hypothetical protein [Pleurocapsa sp. FMAR1]